MKPIRYTYAVLVLLIALLFACTNNRSTRSSTSEEAAVIINNNYSLFPSGSILMGELADGSNIYFIRNDESMFRGFCFVDNNRAVVRKMAFEADSAGVVTFVSGYRLYSGTMVVDSATMTIELSLPEISMLPASRQVVTLRYFGTVSEVCIDCPARFKQPVFDEIIAITDVRYGSARGFYSSRPLPPTTDYVELAIEAAAIKLSVVLQGQRNIPLYLDIYRPANDHVAQSPLVLFIHGGAFVFGDKQNILQQALTEYLVARGYVVAAINYRKGSIFREHFERTFFRNVQDTRAALRFLVSNKERFGIDNRQIYLIGSSAGGIIALKTAFMDSDEIHPSVGGGFFRENLGGLDDVGNNYEADFRIAGVVSMWGAVSNLQMLNNDIPTLLFHGTDDGIVLNERGAPFQSFMGVFHGFASGLFAMYGSKAIYRHLQSQNVPVRYVPFPGYCHDVHIAPDGTLTDNIYIILYEIGNFLYLNVQKHYFNYTLLGNTTVSESAPAPVYQVDNIGDASVQWCVRGGFITDRAGNYIRVVWFDSYSRGKVVVCVTNSNGMVSRRELEVNIN